MEFYSHDSFLAYFSVLAIQIAERGSNFNDMQPRFTLSNHRIEKFLEQENKKKSGHSDSSAKYPSLHNRYIACVYPKYCDYKGGDFPRRTFGFKMGKPFFYYLRYVISCLMYG